MTARDRLLTAKVCRQDLLAYAVRVVSVALAQAGGTIVVLMGVAQLATFAAALIEGGLPADTPVAAIRHATSSEQHVVRCALSELADAAVESPATIVVGAVAAFDLTGEFIRGLAVADT